MTTRITRGIAAVVLVAGAVAFSHSAAASQAPAPQVDYLFDGGLVDFANGSTATPSLPCPPEAPGATCISDSGFATDAAGPHWWWESTGDHGGGLVVDTTAPMGATYTVIVRFAFKDVDGYRKLLDFDDRGADQGLYVNDGLLNFYPLGESEAALIEAEQDYYLAAVRQSTGEGTGTFTVYLRGPECDFTEVLAVEDPDGQSIFSAAPGGGSRIGLFFDDSTTNSEATTAGRSYLLRGWANVALTPEQISESACPTPVPPTPAPEPEPEPAPAMPRFTG
jgi:hypothetical protein